MDADERKDDGGLELPTVQVVRVLFTGDIAIHTVPAPLAVVMVLMDAINGEEVRRSRIIWGDVDSRLWDMSL